LLLLISRSAIADSTLEIHNGEATRGAGPVVFVVPNELASSEKLLVELSDNVVPARWINRERRQAAFILDRDLAPRETLRFQIKGTDTTDNCCRPDGVLVSHDVVAGRIIVSVRGREALTYWTKTRQPPEGIDSAFARSGHLHPVRTPSGKVITSEFPKDHPHQHGIFHAWVNTTFYDRKLDFWNDNDRSGKIAHSEVISIDSGEVFGSFTVRLTHSDITTPEKPIPVLSEQLTVRVWDVVDVTMFDIETQQRCIAAAPLTINEYHYGGMAFRGPDEWLQQPESGMLTSEGKQRKDGNHTRPNWVTAYGNVDGAMRSITAMGHAENFRHPQPVRLHPDKPYFVFTPPQLGKFDLVPSKEDPASEESKPGYVARYRFLVRDVGPDAKWADGQWEAYSKSSIIKE